MLDTFRATDNQTISANGVSLAVLSFSEKEERERIRVAICDPRSSSALVERSHTACSLRNLADFIFSTTMTVDDAGLDDSSRTHISQRVRSCGNFDIAEYSVSEKEWESERGGWAGKGEKARRNSLRPFAGVSIFGDTSHFLSDSDLHSLDSRRLTFQITINISSQKCFRTYIFSCAIKMGQ